MSIKGEKFIPRYGQTRTTKIKGILCKTYTLKCSHTCCMCTASFSCLMLAAFVPTQKQWEPARWQIIPLQPPLSNGKNAAASSSSPMGDNLPSHITAAAALQK